jgi:FdhD protein
MINVKNYDALFYNEEFFKKVTDVISVEVPLKIDVNSISFTITMRTPGSEENLVRGLLHSENIIRSYSELPPILVSETDADGFITAVNVLAPAYLILKDFAGTRNVISASSCGICGKTSLDDNNSDDAKIVNHLKLAAKNVELMFAKMSEKQTSFIASGGTHACAAFTIDGELLAIEEDIGRHNAVDKVIGSLINSKILDQAKCLTVSGRVSYEIISKTLAANIPYLFSVSAPSSLAIDYAEKSGMTLLAFCRNKKLTVYSNPKNVLHNHPEIIVGQVKKTEHV